MKIEPLTSSNSRKSRTVWTSEKRRWRAVGDELGEPYALCTVIRRAALGWRGPVLDTGGKLGRLIRRSA